MSRVGNALTWFLAEARRRGFGHALNRAFRIDTYILRGDYIRKQMGPLYRDQAVALRDIESWGTVPEMIFDIVVLNLTDGRRLTWLDYYDDLLPILRQVAGEKEVPLG